MMDNTETAQSQRQLFDSRILQMRANSPAAEASVAIQQKGWAFLKVSGKSMFPWIREDDVVFVRCVSIASMARGDVAAFEKEGVFCVHRVLHVTKHSANHTLSLITKGDATADKDQPVPAPAFRGKVEFVYRGNREIPIATGWRSYLGKFLALISPMLGLYKPLAAGVDAGTVHSAPRPSPRFAGRRSAEDSAD